MRPYLRHLLYVCSVHVGLGGLRVLCVRDLELLAMSSFDHLLQSYTQ